MSWMRLEIAEQPDAVARALAAEGPRIEQLAAAAKDRGVELLFIAARGTSDHAAILARYLFEIELGLPVCLAAPSVFTLYDAPVRLDRALVLGISQSGEAADANEVLRRARDRGVLTACITNHDTSTMARTAEYPLLCHAGEERSLPATKTYTASLALLYRLAVAMGARHELGDALRQAPTALQVTLNLEASIAGWVERYRYMEECVVLARGVNQATAMETALKLTETSYVRAQPWSGADFMHGPIAAIDEGFPCILYLLNGRAHAPMLELLCALIERKAECLLISDSDEALEEMAKQHAKGAGGHSVRLPEPVDEILSPLVAIVAGQLFAYHLARVKGRDPDAPRGLRKVTVTR
jgi:glucosamine--fructose-6-phosphate aminotransferase (isomerizing)